MVFDKKRIFSGLLILAIFIFFYFFKLNFILIIALILLSIYDILYSKIISQKFLFFGLISFSLLFLFFYENFPMIIFISISLILFLISFFKFRLNNIFFLLLGCFFYSLYIINFENNFIYIIFLISFINDTSAYIFGNTFKGPLIIPKISPKKTWSGTISSFFLSFILFKYFGFSNFYSIILSISLFLGDIYFSYIKRSLKIKDFSNLIPGHGGILDRLDSLFFLPFVIIISTLF